MKSKSALFIAFLTISSLAMGQDYLFKVLASKGVNEVKNGDSWQPVKIGANLKQGDQLRLSENSYVGLIYVKGQPREIKEAGTYDVAKLASEMQAGSTVVQKYTDFILSSNAEAKVNRLSATGAVHRGTAEDISVLLPDANTKVFSNEVVITWETAEGTTGPYVVTFENMFGDVLSKIETPEKTLRVNLADEKFVDQLTVMVSVNSKSDPAKDPKKHAITRLSSAERDRIQASLGEIKGSLDPEQAVSQLILAGFYEENNLPIDALTAYVQAKSMEPGAYDETFEEFLIRQNLKK